MTTQFFQFLRPKTSFPHISYSICYQNPTSSTFPKYQEKNTPSISHSLQNYHLGPDSHFLSSRLFGKSPNWSPCFILVYLQHNSHTEDFSCGSAGKESTGNKCRRLPFNSWVGKILWEGIGYPVQYSWASPVAQLVKNWPAIRETWVWFLGWEYPLGKGKATHSSILAWRIPWTV